MSNIYLIYITYYTENSMLFEENWRNIVYVISLQLLRQPVIAQLVERRTVVVYGCDP